MKLPALERLILQLSRQLSDEDAEQIKYRLEFSTVDRERTSSAGELFSLLRTRHRTIHEFVLKLRDLLCHSDTIKKELYCELLEEYETNNGEKENDSLHNRPSAAVEASLQAPAPPELHHPFRRVLGQIARRVSKKDLNMMRAILVSTESDRSSITSTERLFEILERRGCFDPVNIEYLHDLFDIFDDAPALQKLNMYYQNHVQPPPPPNYAPTPDTYAASDRNIQPSPSSHFSSFQPSTPSLCAGFSQAGPFSSNSHPHSSPANFDSRTITQSHNSIYPNDNNLHKKRPPPSVQAPKQQHSHTEAPPSAKRPRSDLHSTTSDEDLYSPVVPSAPPPPPPPSQASYSEQLSSQSSNYISGGSTMVINPCPPPPIPGSSINQSVSPVSHHQERSLSILTNTDQMYQTPADEIANAAGSSEYVSNSSSTRIPVQAQQQQQPVDDSSSAYLQGQDYYPVIAATGFVDVPPGDNDNSIAQNESQSSNSGNFLHSYSFDEAHDSD